MRWVNTSPTLVLSLLYLLEANLEIGDYLIVWRFQSQLPDKAIIIEVDSEGVDTGYQHVEAQIKFRV